jgi:tetratricopeptide (TPR) repeat protein
MNTLTLRPAIAVILAFATVASGPAAYASQATDLLLNKARSLEGRGLLDLAARSWEQVLLADPSNAEALAGLARVAKINGKKAEADKYLERLRAADPQNPAIVRIGGMKSADQQRGSLNEAQRLAEKKDFDGAMKIYRQAFGNEPPPGNWAISYYETQAATAGGWEDAVAGLDRLVKKYPGSPDYALALGRLFTYRPKTRVQGMQMLESIKGNSALLAKARAAWRQALVWDAGNPASLPSLREYLARYSDMELAKLMTGKEAALPVPEPPKRSPENVREGRAYQALSTGKLKQADQEFTTALKTAPRDARALSGLGYVRMKEQNFTEAASLFEQASALQPKNKDISDALETAKFWHYMKRGTDALNASRAADAIAQFKQALSLRPQNADALRALAGSYEKQQDYSLAVPLYLDLTQMSAAKPDDWFTLARAQYNAGEPQQALTSLQKAPTKTQDQWASDPDRVTLLSFIHADGGDLAGAQALADKAQLLLAKDAGAAPASAQLQFAGLYMKLQQPLRAATVYENIVSVEPSNAEAWAGLLNALVGAGKPDRAEAVLQKIPSDAYQQALKQPQFLESVANIQLALNRGDRAEIYLQKAIELGSASGQKTDAAAQLQLANVWARTGKPAEAERLLRRILDAQPSNTAAWLSYVTALHEQKQDRRALEAIESLPEKVFSTLAGDPAFVTVEAGIYSNLGQYPEALRAVRSAEARLELERKQVPMGLRVQEAWILLNGRGSDRELYALLSRYGSSPNLTESEKKDFNSIWSTWSQKRAAAASDRGDFSGAIRILNTAAQLFPADEHMKGTLAGTYLQAGDARNAYLLYKNWGLKDASADDFSGAVGAAVTVRDKELAERWLARGLHKYPRDARLLSLAGKQAAQQGDYDRAKIYLREALAAAPMESAGKELVQAGDAAAGKRALGALLVGEDLAEPGTALADARIAERGTGADLAGLAAPKFYSDPRSDIDIEALRTEKLGKSIAPVSNQGTIEQQISNDLNALNTRNSPYLTNGTTVQSRTGQGGVDRLMIQEADLEASTTIGNRLRVSLIAKPTYLDSGSAATTNTLGFGSQTGSAVSADRTAFGIGAETQISSQTFGLRLGLSPTNFLVHNWIGGLRLNPGHGPFTILLNRDTLRDTKLSFAGERDSATNQVWGGVLANSASILGNWGDDKSGFYTSIGYQALRGKGVASNSRMDASMGAYFKVLTTKDGSLTAGLNFSGMHYDKNLRYFTLGQGGYFSPQQYFLASIPVRWTGSWNRVLQYSIAGSLGVQHFAEDASPFFPLEDPAGARGRYSSMASTGGNYSLDFRVGYQLAPQWIAGAYANVGNSRDYRNASAGIFLRYLFQPRPLASEINADAVPDWKGSQPFGLPLN